MKPFGFIHYSTGKLEHSFYTSVMSETLNSSVLLDGIRSLILSARRSAARGVNLLQIYTNYGPRRGSMQLPPSQQATQSASSATEATSRGFIETVEYDRFIEFCDACRRFRHIGLCYGPPGVGKTLSAFRYSRSEMIISFDRWTSHSRDQLPINTILYTTGVINTPSRIDAEIGMGSREADGHRNEPYPPGSQRGARCNTHSR
jgi:hypothetical protein